MHKCCFLLYPSAHYYDSTDIFSFYIFSSTDILIIENYEVLIHIFAVYQAYYNYYISFSKINIAVSTILFEWRSSLQIALFLCPLLDWGQLRNSPVRQWGHS